jgi:hypothetical protein
MCDANGRDVLDSQREAGYDVHERNTWRAANIAQGVANGWSHCSVVDGISLRLKYG